MLKALKKDPATAAIRVMMLTSLSQKNAKQFEKDGASFFFEKSDSMLAKGPDSLFAAVDRMLKKINSGMSATVSFADTMPLWEHLSSPELAIPWNLSLPSSTVKNRPPFHSRSRSTRAIQQQRFRVGNYAKGESSLEDLMIAKPWPITTTLVEPGHRSPANHAFSKLPCPLLTC